MRMVMAAVMAATMACAALPANAREKEATTPSGRSEMIFAYMPISDALAQVQAKCMDRGWMVSSQTGNQVVCEIPMGVMQSVLTQMLIGNKYSTAPKAFTRFSLAQVGDHTRVQTQSWAETQMAFGQIQQQQYTDDGTYNSMLAFLAEGGAQFPVGTTFTSRAYLGVDGDDDTWQDGRRTSYGHRLTQVTKGGPGDRMGLQVGDIITKINGRGFRDERGMIAALDRQRVGQNISVAVMREGQETQLSALSEGRPTITLLVRPDDILPGQTSVGMQIAAATMGGLEPVLTAYESAHPDWRRPGSTAMARSSEPPAGPPETDLDKMRREAADAQLRLATAEAAAAQARLAAAEEAAKTVTSSVPAQISTTAASGGSE